jgi:hypothetical protein
MSNGLRTTWTRRRGTATSRAKTSSASGDSLRRAVAELVAEDAQRACLSLPLAFDPVAVLVLLAAAERLLARALEEQRERLVARHSVDRDERERVRRLRDHDVRMRVEQRADQAVAALRVADEQAEGLEIGVRGRASLRFARPHRRGR